jgi:ATP-dependent Clp endopeptidase proteolytic subunit ClpP
MRASSCFAVSSAAACTFWFTTASAAEKKKKKKKAPQREKDAEKHLLHERRIVTIMGRIDEKSAAKAVQQMLLLDQAEGSTPGKFTGLQRSSGGTAAVEPITLLIMSGGGLVTAGLAIYDTMQLVSCPVHCVAVGRASSMAAVLLAGGEKGHRLCTPNTRIMVHEASQSIARHKVRGERQILFPCLLYD